MKHSVAKPLRIRNRKTQYLLHSRYGQSMEYVGGDYIPYLCLMQK